MNLRDGLGRRLGAGEYVQRWGPATRGARELLDKDRTGSATSTSSGPCGSHSMHRLYRFPCSDRSSRPSSGSKRRRALVSPPVVERRRCPPHRVPRGRASMHHQFRRRRRCWQTQPAAHVGECCSKSQAASARHWCASADRPDSEKTRRLTVCLAVGRQRKQRWEQRCCTWWWARAAAQVVH